MGFTAAELAEMARADAEIEATFRMTNDDVALGRQIDREAVLDRMDSKHRRLAEYMRRYREAHKDERAEYMRQYREANREKVAEYQRRYRRRKRMEAEGNVNDLQD